MSRGSPHRATARGYMFVPPQPPGLPGSLGLHRVLTWTQPDQSMGTTQKQDTEVCPFLTGTEGGVPGPRAVHCPGPLTP